MEQPHPDFAQFNPRDRHERPPDKNVVAGLSATLKRSDVVILFKVCEKLFSHFQARVPGDDGIRRYGDASLVARN
jgi:hypothetical protein